MAKIIVCTGMGEPEFSSNKGLIAAFRNLGHEAVTCGPGYWGRPAGDVAVDDKQFPEKYTYEEVLEKAPWTPDFMLQIEPHFFLTGEKPPEIKSAYYFTDPHAAGYMWHKMILEGQFNLVLCGQKYFLPLFRDTPCRAEWLPPGFDERRFSGAVPKSPIADIVFVGQTGLANLDFFLEDENGCYTDYVPECQFSGAPPSYDYAERAALLYRLARDFTIRIYNNVWETPNLENALQTGLIGFNRSLLHDISIRCYEVMAAGRYLVTDKIPYLSDNLGMGALYTSYNSYYRPFYQNFDLEYLQVYRLIRNILNNWEGYSKVAYQAQQWAWNNHTWRHRAQRILELL